jgi:hypothetical protein
MGIRSYAAVVGCALATCLMGAAVVSPAASAGSGRDAAATTPARVARAAGAWSTLALYRMDETAGPTMFDSSPNELDGTIGGDVVLNGQYFRYPRVRHLTYRPDHPSVVDSPLLNPYASSFRVSWRFRVSPLARPVYAPNFLQKGQGWPDGGMFKVMNHKGQVGCLFRDGSRQAAVSTSASYNDGEWHVATCARIVGDDPRVVVLVDGHVLGVNRKYVGMIDNSWPLAIGGNTKCNGNQGTHPQHCNYWHGDMSWLRIQVQEASTQR